MADVSKFRIGAENQTLEVKDAAARQAIDELGRAAGELTKNFNEFSEEVSKGFEDAFGGSSIVEVTENKTLAIEDYGACQKVIADSLDAVITITVPLHVNVPFPVGKTEIEIVQYGQSGVVIAGEAGVIIRSMDSMVEIAGQYGIVTLKKMGENDWLLGGALA